MVVVAFVLIILLSVIDNSFSSALFLMMTYFVGIGLTFSLPNRSRSRGRKVFDIVFFIYIIVAFIVSQSFSISDHFMVSDSSRYIESYINRISFYYVKQDFINCYLHFSDSNILYNAYLNAMAMFVNTHLDGMTIYGMTLLQTLWGILSSIILYRILSRHFKEEKASYYTLVFALCSLFLFYSTIIIRDIIICFLYLCIFDVVDQKFSLTGLVKLIIFMILAWGVRLYSGLFLITFIAYYLYIRFRTSRLKYIAIILFVVGMVLVVRVLFTSFLMEQTTAELQGYEELSAERSAGGIVSKLQTLPSGFSHFAIVLFTMIRPMPPFGIYWGVQTFSHIVMSSMFLIAGFFWFVVFYSLCYQLFLKKYFFKIPFEQVALLLICLMFMLANAFHPDIRRMLPVFPILFVQFTKICETEKVKLFRSRISKYLMIFYVVMAFGMLVVM